jgi:hypothetical protein
MTVDLRLQLFSKRARQKSQFYVACCAARFDNHRSLEALASERQAVAKTTDSGLQIG